MTRARPEVERLDEAVHGAIDHAELRSRGIDPGAVIDFSASVNPFGPSPAAVHALRETSIGEYPDRSCTALRSALSRRLGIPAESLLAGNGSSELLLWIALAYLRPADNVLIVGPTYGEYQRVAALMGAHVQTCSAAEPTGFAVPVAEVDASLAKHRPRVAFVCNPNNPTGQAVSAEQIKVWAADFPQTLLVIDEAYIELADAVTSLVGTLLQNVAVVRSLTKAHALAGLRLGYLVAPPATIDLVRRVRPPWTVSAVAQAAGIAAIEDQAHLDHCRQQLARAKGSLVKSLHEIGMNVIPSAAPFLMVKVRSATQVRNQLLDCRLLVRDCTSFGLPNYIRVSPRRDEENQALVAALRAL